MEGNYSLVGVLILTVLILVKDVIVPLIQRRNGKNRNAANHPDAWVRGEFAAFKATCEAQREEQLRVNDQVRENTAKIFDRLDEISRQVG